MIVVSRFAKIAAQLEKYDLDAMLLTAEANRFYGSGFHSTGTDGMAAALQVRQHPQGICLVGRFAQPLVIQKDHGVGGDDDVIGIRQCSGGACLHGADAADDLLRGEAGVIALVRLRDKDGEIVNADAMEQLLPTGRLGG